jgi:hypothetical protein
MMDWKQIGPYLFPILIVALIARRAMRSQKPQRIRPGRLWIQPGYLGIGTLAALSSAHDPGVLGILLFMVGAAAGIGAGYMRALHQEFSIDPETGNVMAKGTPIAALLFIGVFVARFGLSYLMKQGANVPAHSGQFLVYADAMLIFAFAMSAASAWEIWRRTRPLIAEHKSSNGPPPAIPQA